MSSFVLPDIRPEEIGLSSGVICDFLDYVERKNIQLHGFVLLRHGACALRCSWNPFEEQTHHPMYSITKNFVSAAIGIAIQEKLLSLDELVLSFFPDKSVDPDDPFVSTLTVRDLLTMSSGCSNGTGNVSTDDWIADYLRVPRSHAPGSVFFYENMAAHMLCAILQRVTGTTTLDYMTPRLLEPLGIKGLTWSTCPMGINTGGYGVRCTIGDIALLGQLYLQKGMWNGVQLLPAWWVEKSTSKQIDNSGSQFMVEGQCGYGYLFWRGRNNSYLGFGGGGQFVVVVPDLDVVFATTANTLQFFDSQQQILDSVWDCLLTRLAPSALPILTKDAVRLEKKLKVLILPIPKANAAPLFQVGTSLHCSMMANNAGIASCTVTMANDGCELILTHKGVDGVIRAGYMEWKRCEPAFFTGQCAACCAWVAKRTLLVHVERLEEESGVMIITLHFGEKTLTLHSKATFQAKEPSGLMGLNTEDYTCFSSGFYALIS
jgi:CubicO group peptidase (beta-lactamase class C family)